MLVRLGCDAASASTQEAARLHAGGEVRLDGGQRGGEELVEDGVLGEEVGAEEVLAGRRVHQQLVYAPEYDLRGDGMLSARQLPQPQNTADRMATCQCLDGYAVYVRMSIQCVNVTASEATSWCAQKQSQDHRAYDPRSQLSRILGRVRDTPAARSL